MFFTPAYVAVLDPASSTGSFENSIGQFKALQADPERDVLVLGDSRIYAGLDPAIADASGQALHFLNAGIPGTNPRCWYFFVRAVDPSASRFRAVVIPVDSYTDDTSAIGSLDADDHQNDLRYVVLEATPWDAPGLTRNFSDENLRTTLAFDLALRGPVLRPDVQDLLRDPMARLQSIRAFPADAYSPEGWHPFDAGLADMKIDFAHDKIDYPDRIGPDERSEMEKQVLRRPAPSPSYASYRERWLGPIVARYRAANVPVIFVRIPTRPEHRVTPAAPSGSIVDLATRFGATLVPQAAYVALERTRIFADHDHLNREGSLAFSTLIGRDVAAAVATAKLAPARGVGTASKLTGSQPESLTMSVSDFARGFLRFGQPIQFQSLDFVVFFTIVAVAFFALPASLRRWLLAASSYYFYARWNTAFVFVLAALTLSDYFIARALEASEGDKKRWLTIFGVSLNLAFLATFKYVDFATGSVAALLGKHPNPWYVDLFVPVGISFHTFQSISYLVDVSRRKMRAVTSLLDYALYIAFFPQLLSGPIVRAELFFAELAAWRRPSAADVEAGLAGILLGLVKKLAIADQFAPSVDAYFASPQSHPGTLAAWGATFAFAMQIYFDFSGYTDIAIGCARILGFAFPANFARPYFAQTITSFWRRWNMTLSSWLRDYLYIPLGGNRHGSFNTYRNLIITMLLAGLWHGASWTFVAWGGYHGALLAVERRFGLGTEPKARVLKIARWLGTFVLVCIGWVLFRASSFQDAYATLGSMFALTSGSLPECASWPLPLVIVSFAIGAASEAGWIHRTLAQIPATSRAFALAAMLVSLELLSATGESIPFVYFKF